MSRLRATAKHLELSGLAEKRPAHYASYNMTNGVPVEGVPVPPKGITRKGKKFWNTTVPALYQMGVLSATDMSQLESLLFAYEELQRSMDDLRRWESEDRELTPDNIRIRKNLITIYNAAQANFNTLAGHFGMTPVDRTKLPSVLEETEVEVDPLDQLLGD